MGDLQQGQQGPSSPSPVRELSRMDELIQQIGENNQRFSNIKGQLYDVAERLAGPWAKENDEAKQPSADNNEPTKMEKLTVEVNRFHRHLSELDDIVNRLRQTV